MITLLIWILVLSLVFGVIVWAIRLIPLPSPFNQVALAVVAIIFILVLVELLLGPLHAPGLLLR